MLCTSVNSDVQKNLDREKLPDGSVPKAVRDAVNYATSPRSSGRIAIIKTAKLILDDADIVLHNVDLLLV